MNAQSRSAPIVAGALLLTTMAAEAAQVEITAKKLILLDKTFVAGRAKSVFVSTDAGIVKGSGTHVDDIAARLDVVYGSRRGSFVIPAGASEGAAPGWTANDGRVARYENDQAPGGPTVTKITVVKPGRLLKLVARGLGDVPLDVLGGGGIDGVSLAYCVDNADETTCHCSEFPTGSCRWEPVGGGSGAKLTCRGGIGDTSCSAATTTTTSTTTTTTVPDLSGFWTFTWTGGSSTCTTASAPSFESAVTLVQTETDLTGIGTLWTYSGMVSPTDFRLNRSGIPPLVQCFFGNGIYEAFLTMSGDLPVLDGVVPVTQQWALVPLIFDPQCPSCAVTWTGTMELAFVPE